MSDVSNDNESTEAVLTVSELATRWKCTRKAVLTKIRIGQLHAFRIGSRVFRISLAEVKRHEEAA